MTSNCAVRQSGTNNVGPVIPWADGFRMRHPQSLAKSLSQVLTGTNWSDMLFKDNAVQFPTPDGFDPSLPAGAAMYSKLLCPDLPGRWRPEPAGRDACCRQRSGALWPWWRAGMPDGVHYQNARMRSRLFVNGREVPRRGPVYWQHAAALTWRRISPAPARIASDSNITASSPMRPPFTCK